MTSICGGDDGDWDISVTGTSNVVAEGADYKYNYKYLRFLQWMR